LGVIYFRVLIEQRRKLAVLVDIHIILMMKRDSGVFGVDQMR
jgi:hypothetical protein